jgi:hypothetical protein
MYQVSCFFILFHLLPVKHSGFPKLHHLLRQADKCRRKIEICIRLKRYHIEVMIRESHWADYDMISKYCKKVHFERRGRGHYT